MIKYSFVIPCYRSEKTIESVVSEIEEVLHKNNDKSEYEIVLVNDCSPDEVWSVIKKMSERDPRIRGINFARNFGQHSALMAGYSVAKGEYVVSLDDDGQTPINELYNLMEKFEEGCDVVYAYYQFEGQSWYRKLGTKVADKMGELLIGMPKGHRGSSFYVMKRFVAEEMVRYQNAYPYVAGLVFRTTKNVACVPANRKERMEGESGYNLRSLFHLWFNGFSAFSSKPLEVSAYLGIIMAVVGVIYAIVIVVKRIIDANAVLAGWSSIMAALLLIGGMILVSLGLIGEYVGRIYISINSAPQYVIKETTNMDKEK